MRMARHDKNKTTEIVRVALQDITNQNSYPFGYDILTLTAHEKQRGGEMYGM